MGVMAGRQWYQQEAEPTVQIGMAWHGGCLRLPGSKASFQPRGNLGTQPQSLDRLPQASVPFRSQPDGGGQKMDEKFLKVVGRSRKSGPSWGLASVL